MVERTSWDGTFTKELRKQGVRGFYTRYINRRTKTGLEIVVPRANWNDIFTPEGIFKGREPKYHNFSGNENTANKIYNRDIKKEFRKQLRMAQRR